MERIFPAPEKPGAELPPLHTVGHSDRSLDAFVGLLREFGISLLVDVRRYPSSRRHPHFNAGSLAEALGDHGVDYRHEEALGGYRDPRDDSPHTALGRAGFRAYADHMASGDFRTALARVLDEARRRRVAVMCAEADPERCHRRMIADAALARGRTVVHILGPGETAEHELDERARVLEDGGLAYPSPDDAQRDLFGGEGTGAAADG